MQNALGENEMGFRRNTNGNFDTLIVPNILNDDPGSTFHIKGNDNLGEFDYIKFSAENNNRTIDIEVSKDTNDKIKIDNSKGTTDGSLTDGSILFNAPLGGIGINFNTSKLLHIGSGKMKFESTNTDSESVLFTTSGGMKLDINENLVSIITGNNEETINGQRTLLITGTTSQTYYNEKTVIINSNLNETVTGNNNQTIIGNSNVTINGSSGYTLNVTEQLKIMSNSVDPTYTTTESASWTGGGVDSGDANIPVFNTWWKHQQTKHASSIYMLPNSDGTAWISVSASTEAGRMIHTNAFQMENTHENITYGESLLTYYMIFLIILDI